MTDLEPPEIGEPTRPALETLVEDQRDVLSSFLVGFDTREDVLRWSQEALLATLGQLDAEWYKTRLLSFAELSALLVTEERYRWVDDPEDALSLERAKQYRLALASQDLVPACRDGLQEIRWSAAEYTNDDDEDDPTLVDPEEQRHTAMRPALTEAAERQEWVVDRALEGFDDLDDVLTWTTVAMQASYGEADDDLASDFWTELPLREMFIERDDRAAKFYRASFVATELLPPFNRTYRLLTDRSGEVVTEPESPDHSPEAYPEADT